MPLINGRAYSHNSSTIQMAGVPFSAIKSIDYSHGVEGSAFVHGTSKKPLARTLGTYKPGDVSVEMAEQEWTQLKLLLGPGFMERSFPITVARQELLSFETDVLVSCRIKNVAKSSAEGGEATMAKLTIECMEVIENGIPAILSLTPSVAV